MNGLLKSSVAALIFLAPGVAAAAGWTVVSDQSTVAFVSVKADAIGEVMHFTSVSGTVSQDGQAKVTIPLKSVETNVDVRNERMRDFLFETMKFPDAVITAKLDMAKLTDIAVGERTRLPLEATVEMHGLSLDIEPDVYVTHVAENQVLVETATPVIVTADDFEMQPGLDKLKELAALPSITPVVPVTFSLMFEAE
jgi:polyisoprenoid-binding protein YceI